MAAWIRACATDEVETEDLIRFDLGKESFVIIRSPENELFVMDGIRSHEHVHLCDGLVMDGIVECSKHNAEFDYRNGEATRAAACINRMTFPVRIVDGAVWIEV
ncbi:MAG TPA: non-heme iron oxygenase ferredoxin subunit [Albidovulum sp.]|uniref:non-heme iron oxygenase ferredoxin subunit n=1 Tax=Albidovulum sp. TaxID=1872424 RepID=UPI002D113A97|nr:non-heme iron oxygenase ferredoxin subunit [Albidovulum sp.]